MKRITVLLAEDHQIVREGFRSLLKHEDDIEVVGEAENGREAVQLTRKLRARRSGDGHRHAAAQWLVSHAANSQRLSRCPGPRSLRA